jgi:hypothetical protein
MLKFLFVAVCPWVCFGWLQEIGSNNEDHVTAREGVSVMGGVAEAERDNAVTVVGSTTDETEGTRFRISTPTGPNARMSLFRGHFAKCVGGTKIASSTTSTSLNALHRHRCLGFSRVTFLTSRSMMIHEANKAKNNDLALLLQARKNRLSENDVGTKTMNDLFHFFIRRG